LVIIDLLAPPENLHISDRLLLTLNAP
jgi:hypothetical protein